MKKAAFLLTAVIFVFLAKAQEKLDYFLPSDVQYNKAIPTPEDFFNQPIGEWHLTHNQILYYMKEIARLSDRAVMYEYARTYENKALVHLVFTSPKNQQNLEQLKKAHFDYSEPGSNKTKDGVPLVVSLTYGVHGNESSGPNSSVLTAYYLAAAQGKKIDSLLNQTIIIVDPCLNPDGFTRHSTWANMHQSKNELGNNESRQFDEVWPGGRTNHYWFDLNRDYLLLVNPESRGRVAKFHQWKPNIVTDHHEMGSSSTFFFQPGVPSRNNPLTPEKNYELTHKIAAYHAQFLDKIGSAYFSEEQFDDYYFGKGSSYPDINGSIGILFEQAGFRGRVRQTPTGIKSLAFAIKNQLTTSLSTLEAALNLHDELLDLQKDFYNSALQLADKDETKAYVFGSSTDKIKTQKFIGFLNQHQINVFENEKDIRKNKNEFLAGSSFVVPVKQKQYRLIKSIFEEVTEFTDTTFYDVSTWTFPYTYDIPFERLSSEKELNKSAQKVIPQKIVGNVVGGKSELGYLFRWNEFSAAGALYRLQNAGLKTQVATDKFKFEINGSMEDFSYGTILVWVSNQKLSSDRIYQLVQNTAQKTGIDFYGLSTGLSPVGIDAGSRSFAYLDKPAILLFVGGSTSSRDAGEIWHLFDQRYQIPVTLSETKNIRSADFNKYNTIILPGGSYTEWSTSETEKLKNWVQNGGTLIAYKSAAAWAARNKLIKTKFKPSVKPDSSIYLKYAERNKERSLNSISGAIFNTKIDVTHPLCYGYTRPNLAIFKTGTSVAIPLETKYSEPVKLTDNPYISGWVSAENVERIKNTPVVSVQQFGRGKVISYFDNMNFRGTWLGTSKLFSNAVFFGSIIR